MEMAARFPTIGIRLILEVRRRWPLRLGAERPQLLASLVPQGFHRVNLGGVPSGNVGSQ